jgi:S1-C subfamily serine protease
MHDCPKGGGAGPVRRLRARLVAGAILAAAALGAAGPGAAGGGDPLRPAGGALAYHATVVNGAVTGSSFQIADGLALTNAHVVRPAGPGDEVTLMLGGPGDGRRARARILAVSARMDLAVLAVAPGLLPVAPVADAPAGRGSAVRAAGVVAGAGGPGARMELDGRIDSGAMLVAAFGPGVIATMPGIRRGFSGGPVFDGAGRLVGMVAALRPDPGAPGGAGGAGREAFILTADAIRAEAARLVGAISAR